MPEESGGKVVVTLKAADGFNAPWVVLHGDDPEDAWNLLREVAPLEGAENMSLGELTIAQAKAFQDAWAASKGSRPSAGSRTSGGRGGGTQNARSGSGNGTSNRSSGRTSGGGGKSRTMRSDQWPDGLGPEDFDECPKHGPLIFKDEFEKDNGSVVSARVSCSTPFCNAAPTYWDKGDGNFEAS